MRYLAKFRMFKNEEKLKMNKIQNIEKFNKENSKLTYKKI